MGHAKRIEVLGPGLVVDLGVAAFEEGKLEAKGAFKVAAGTKVVALVTLPGKKAANVRFAVK